ncbi:MAG: PadR family transcriptional regulator [Candidatus Thermoplasmatota archaeon]|nr:PadR family transcriptional regulator [Candidatus Thermoplasmatota archaeon]
MPIISNREAALLSLLCERPMYAYEIEKIIEERNMRYWTEISFSTLYYELKKLEKKQLVNSNIQLSKNNVAQKIYTINISGKKAMKKKVKEVLSNMEKIIWQIDLGMANICMLSKDETIEAFTKYISSIDEHILIYQHLLDFFKKNNYPDSDCALAERPLKHLDVERQWAKEYLEGVRNGTKTNWINRSQQMAF